MGRPRGPRRERTARDSAHATSGDGTRPDIVNALKLGLELDLPLAVARTTAIVGQCGTGKTSTAVVLVEQAARAGVQPR